jgi:hypothetical protein
VNQPDESQPDTARSDMGQPDPVGPDLTRIRPDRVRGHGDLLGHPIPRGDWGDPAHRLDELYLWAESRALRTTAWYLRDRRWKTRTALALRSLAAGRPAPIPRGSAGSPPPCPR